MWLAANHLPKIHGTDLAIWRRIRVIPFTVTITDTERDPHLAEALEAEMTGILAWAIEGCRQWQQLGLEPPNKVLAATNNYRADMDWFKAWIDDSGIELGNGLMMLTSDLQRSYRTWATDNGDTPVDRRVLAKELLGNGCTPKKFNSAHWWRGLGKSSDVF